MTTTTQDIQSVIDELTVFAIEKDRYYMVFPGELRLHWGESDLRLILTKDSVTWASPWAGRIDVINQYKQFVLNHLNSYSADRFNCENITELTGIVSI